MLLIHTIHHWILHISELIIIVETRYLFTHHRILLQHHWIHHIHLIEYVLILFLLFVTKIYFFCLFDSLIYNLNMALCIKLFICFRTIENVVYTSEKMWLNCTLYMTRIIYIWIFRFNLFNCKLTFIFLLKNLLELSELFFTLENYQ